MPSTLPARPRTRRVRLIGAVIATVGMILTSAPIVASADEPATRRVTVEVTVSNLESEAALAGAAVTLRAEPSGEEAGTGRTGLDGRIAFDIDPEASSQYSAHAQWPNGVGAVLSSSREFRSADAEVVSVRMESGYRYVSGRVTANVGGTAVPDLTGGTAVITRDGISVQELPLAADGSFMSQALPTDAAEAYRLAFTPPSGYALVAGQAAPAFALPTDADGATTLEVSREFSVTSTVTPEPTPTPVPTPDPTPTSAPTPTAEPTPVPVPTSEPAPAGSPVVVPGAADMGTALNGISESQLDSLLDAVQQAGPGNVVPITNDLGQVLGLASQPQAPAQQALLGVVGSANGAMPSVAPQGIPLASMDLETALQMVQANRASLLEAQLAQQIRDVQARNEQIALLNTALGALNLWKAGGRPEDHELTTKALRAIGKQDLAFDDVSRYSFLPPDEARGAAADAAIMHVKNLIDAESNSQQMDMLRLQSLSNKRNEAFDVMTNFVKKMQDSRSSIIGNMRSQPVAIGTAQWNNGTVTGSFDVSGVPYGAHHLILTFTDAGFTVIADVDVQRGKLASTGAEATATFPIGVGMLFLGVVTVIAAPMLRRREQTPGSAR